VGALSRPDLLSDLTLQFDAIAERRDAEHGPASVRAFEFAARIRYLRALCRDLNRPYLLDLGRYLTKQQVKDLETVFGLALPEAQEHD
jgi:hypothetical protein